MMPKRTRFKYRSLPGGRRQAEPVAPAFSVDMAGTIPDILAAVGTNKAAARYAIDAERRADRPRRTLIDKLEAV